MALYMHAGSSTEDDEIRCWIFRRGRSEMFHWQAFLDRQDLGGNLAPKEIRGPPGAEDLDAKEIKVQREIRATLVCQLKWTDLLENLTIRDKVQLNTRGLVVLAGLLVQMAIQDWKEGLENEDRQGHPVGEDRWGDSGIPEAPEHPGQRELVGPKKHHDVVERPSLLDDLALMANQDQSVLRILWDLRDLLEIQDCKEKLMQMHWDYKQSMDLQSPPDILNNLAPLVHKEMQGPLDLPRTLSWPTGWRRAQPTRWRLYYSDMSFVSSQRRIRTVNRSKIAYLRCVADLDRRKIVYSKDIAPTLRWSQRFHFRPYHDPNETVSVVLVRLINLIWSCPQLNGYDLVSQVQDSWTWPCLRLAEPAVNW